MTILFASGTAANKTDIPLSGLDQDWELGSYLTLLEMVTLQIVWEQEQLLQLQALLYPH